MSKTKIHAERNRKLSNDLYDGKVYFDWTVTTAFYSAIHFVESAFLPGDVKGQRCENINDVKKAYKCEGRHETRERLVCEKMTLKSAAYYAWLDNKSRYSRYTTYKVTNTEAEKALTYLNAISEECYPTKVEEAS
jgi:hypothetical protein